MIQRDDMGWEVEGGFRIGNSCTHVADSCQCMAKPILSCKVKKKKNTKTNKQKKNLANQKNKNKQTKKAKQKKKKERTKESYGTYTQWSIVQALK